jgi:hypothetical protein
VVHLRGAILEPSERHHKVARLDHAHRSALALDTQFEAIAMNVGNPVEVLSTHPFLRNDAGTEFRSYTRLSGPAALTSI